MLPGVILAGDLNIFRGDKVDGRIMSYLLNHVVNTQIARIAQGSRLSIFKRANCASSH